MIIHSAPSDHASITNARQLKSRLLTWFAGRRSTVSLADSFRRFRGSNYAGVALRDVIHYADVIASSPTVSDRSQLKVQLISGKRWILGREKV